MRWVAGNGVLDTIGAVFVLIVIVIFTLLTLQLPAKDRDQLIDQMNWNHWGD
jgi:hypothetical protein